MPPRRVLEGMFPPGRISRKMLALIIVHYSQKTARLASSCNWYHLVMILFGQGEFSVPLSSLVSWARSNWQYISSPQTQAGRLLLSLSSPRLPTVTHSCSPVGHSTAGLCAAQGCLASWAFIMYKKEESVNLHLAQRPEKSQTDAPSFHL